MNNITLTDYIDFFRQLDLKQKIEILKELTNELGKAVDQPVNQIKEAPKNEGHQVIDELFGVWKDEEELTEESIIDRTISDKIIDFD